MHRFCLSLLLLPLCSCRDEETPPRPVGEDEPAALAYVSHHPLREELPLSVWCAACHGKEFEAWKDSGHAHAWRKLSPAADEAAFQGQRLRAHGEELCFTRKEDGTPVVQNISTGKEYAVDSVAGHKPFIQYLVKGERGALQSLSAGWDVQRGEWFDTMAEDARLLREGSAERRPGDWGHWLGGGMTWNSQCASCHMSSYQKNYDAGAGSYASTWLEPGVTCIQCHALKEVIKKDNGRPIRRNKNNRLTAKQISDTCAACHARREELRPGFREGDLFDDYFRLELPLVEGIFWPNGMQRDEVYTETGMRLSPMGKAGVTCLDCHDPHSNKLRLPMEDNSLCLRCHGSGREVNGTKAPVIDMNTHSPCPPESLGARCVECHMPASGYMARDLRRDHSFGSPDPALSEELGIPNACTTCHTDKDNTWAAAAVEKTYGKEPGMAKYRPRTRAVAAAMKGEGNTDDLLAAYKAEQNPTWQATLMELLARQAPSETVRDEARKAAESATPLLRAAAAKVLGCDAPQLLNDPVRVVRHAAAWAQLDNLLAAEQAHPALAELEETLRHQADHPAGAMQAASLAHARARHALGKGDTAAADSHEAEAERHFRRAIAADPHSAAARMDFAVFLAQQERLLEALEQMLACTAANPDNAEAQYRLALLLHELGHSQPALRALEKTVQLAPSHERARRALMDLQQYLHTKQTPSAPTP